MYTTATLTDILPPDMAVGRIKVLVTHTGNAGEPPILQELWIDGSLTAAQLQAQVAAKCATLNSVVTVRNQITKGQTVSTVVVAATPPTQAQLDQMKFFSDLAKLQQFQTLITLKVLTGSESEYTTLLAAVKTEYQPAYFA